MSSILLVDDNTALLEMMAVALREEGYETWEAQNGREAMRLLETVSVDLIITDIVMPEQDGIETMMKLRKSHPDLPIIAISGDSRTRAPLYLSLAGKLGAVHTLLKPFTIPDLLRATRKALLPDAGSS